MYHLTYSSCELIARETDYLRFGLWGFYWKELEKDRRYTTGYFSVHAYRNREHAPLYLAVVAASTERLGTEILTHTPKKACNSLDAIHALVAKQLKTKEYVVTPDSQPILSWFAVVQDQELTEVR